MKRGLVSLRETETHRDLLSEAMSYAEGSSGELVVLWHLEDDEYDEGVRTLEAVGRIEHVEYDHSSIIEGASEDARSFIRRAAGDTDVDVHVVVGVGSEDGRAEQILETADEHGCDHVFLVGDSRSPTGKAVFGDVAQRVILDFDGYTTTTTV
ncbi:universal stress protein [Halorubrum sp. HHNYT27]|uniref:universal stress protein n=1 Tax=Halorubrum sp. HHNYT27 TaxID=3402275 RepID=UPI003EB729C2